MEKIVYLLIPDVHGRDFWINPLDETLRHKGSNVIFLGDYLDCYPREWDKDVDYKRLSIERFKKIIEIKKENPSRIHLLLGNHKVSIAF